MDHELGHDGHTRRKRHREGDPFWLHLAAERQGMEKTTVWLYGSTAGDFRLVYALTGALYPPTCDHDSKLRSSRSPLPLAASSTLNFLSL